MDVLKPAEGRTFQTFGIWLGYPYELSFKREGFARYAYNLANSLVKYHQLNCEVWCYQENLEEARDLFRGLLGGAHRKQIKIISDKNYFGHFPESIDKIPKSIVEIIHDHSSLEAKRKAFPWLANLISKCECMIVPLITIDTAVYLDFPLLISMHDLVVHEFADAFRIWYPERGDQEKPLTKLAEEFAGKGAFFCSNSDYVRKKHILRYIPALPESMSGFVHLPVILPENSAESLPDKNSLFRKFGIDGEAPYLFVPTQVRPYKNIEIVVEALSALVAEGTPLQLVMTGVPHSVLADFISSLSCSGHIILTGDLTEAELYAFHKYALATVAPSLFEGGFPWQGLEAMAMGTPAIMARIPVTLERLRSISVEPEYSGLLLFAPNDYKDLINQIKIVLSDRTRVVEGQKRIKERLEKYTWKDTGDQYFQILNTLIKTPESELSPCEDPQTVRLKKQVRLMKWRCKGRLSMYYLSKIPYISKVLRLIYRWLKGPDRIAALHTQSRSLEASLNSIQNQLQKLEKKINQIEKDRVQSL